jgi:hypothetical protein
MEPGTPNPDSVDVGSDCVTPESRAVISRYTIDGNPRSSGSDAIHIERAKQIEGPAKWAVRRHGDCLNKQGEWEYEPMPSSRDDEFLARCRFDSPAEALAVICKATPDSPLSGDQQKDKPTGTGR